MHHPLLLLHGTPLTPQIWAETAALLGPRAVVTPDTTRVAPAPASTRVAPMPAAAPTPGDSPSPEAAAPPSAQAALAARVASGLSGGPFDVVGHSFGGQIALELALLAPASVRSLTIVCSRDTPFPPFGAVARGLRSGVPVDTEASLGRWFTASELAADLPVVERVRTTLATASLPDWADALDAIAQYDAHTRTSALSASMPVTLVAAGHDAVSTPAVMAEMADRMPGSTFTVMPDWAHMSAFAYPDRLAALIGASTSR